MDRGCTIQQRRGRSVRALFFSLAAIAAEAADEEAMAEDLEVVLAGDRIANALDLVAVELDQLVTDFAVQMVVTGIAVFVLVDASPAQGHLADQAGLGQLAEGAVDRRAAHLALGDQLLQMVHQLVGVEVVVMAEDLLDDEAALLSDPLPPRLEKLHEPILGRLGWFDGTERIVARHEASGSEEEGLPRVARSRVRPGPPARTGGTLADLVEKPSQGNLQLIVSFVGAVGNLSPDLVHPILADLGQVAHLVDELSCVGQLQFVLDGTCLADRLPVRDPRRVRGTDGLGSVQMGRTVNVHLSTPKRTPLEEGCGVSS